jgi:excisionase family DNA binding protein
VKSTREIAKLVGIGTNTLEVWLRDGKIPAPKMLRIGQKQFRNWTKKDIAQIRKYKAANYRKGRGRKKKAN